MAAPSEEVERTGIWVKLKALPFQNNGNNDYQSLMVFHRQLKRYISKRTTHIQAKVLDVIPLQTKYVIDYIQNCLSEKIKTPVKFDPTAIILFGVELIFTSTINNCSTRV